MSWKKYCAWKYSKYYFSISDWKEGKVLFNDVLNTFYLRLYGVGHMLKDHSDSEIGNPLPPYWLLFPINSKDYFYIHHPTDRIAHTTAFVTPVVEHWLEREIAQWVHPMKDWSDDPSHHERTLLPQSYISLLISDCVSHSSYLVLWLPRYTGQTKPHAQRGSCSTAGRSLLPWPCPLQQYRSTPSHDQVGLKKEREEFMY